jgi:hypothetical protein
MSNNPAGDNFARILPFKRPPRDRPRAVSMIMRPAAFTLPAYCPNSPEFKHAWKATEISGWYWCVHCKGWRIDASGKVVNLFPAEGSFNHCPGSPDHKHRWQDLTQEGKPGVLLCGWCALVWHPQPGAIAEEGR